jgi:hypothetical protein
MSPLDWVEYIHKRVVNPDGSSPDDIIYLNKDGKEIHRVADGKKENTYIQLSSNDYSIDEKGRVFSSGDQRQVYPNSSSDKGSPGKSKYTAKTTSEPAKLSTTTPDPANSEPRDQSTENTATVVGITSDILEQGVQQGANLASSVAKGAVVGSQEAEQLAGVAKQAGALGKVLKGTGVVANAVGAISATSTLINDPTAGNATRLAVQGAAIGVAFIPVFGWGISLGISVADAIWGDDFYNWIDKR